MIYKKIFKNYQKLSKIIKNYKNNYYYNYNNNYKKL